MILISNFKNHVWNIFTVATDVPTILPSSIDVLYSSWTNLGDRSVAFMEMLALLVQSDCSESVRTTWKYQKFIREINWLSNALLTWMATFMTFHVVVEVKYLSCYVQPIIK